MELEGRDDYSPTGQTPSHLSKPSCLEGGSEPARREDSFHVGSVGSGLRTEGLRMLQKASYVLSLDSHCLGAQADVLYGLLHA